MFPDRLWPMLYSLKHWSTIEEIMADNVELMRENIKLRKKNAALMNQNMRLIIELKEKEHNIFKQNIILAKYRKR